MPLLCNLVPHPEGSWPEKNRLILRSFEIRAPWSPRLRGQSSIFPLSVIQRRFGLTVVRIPSLTLGSSIEHLSNAVTYRSPKPPRLPTHTLAKELTWATESLHTASAQSTTLTAGTAKMHIRDPMIRLNFANAHIDRLPHLVVPHCYAPHLT